MRVPSKMNGNNFNELRPRMHGSATSFGVRVQSAPWSVHAARSAVIGKRRGCTCALGWYATWAHRFLVSRRRR